MSVGFGIPFVLYAFLQMYICCCIILSLKVSLKLRFRGILGRIIVLIVAFGSMFDDLRIFIVSIIDDENKLNTDFYESICIILATLHLIFVPLMIVALAIYVRFPKIMSHNSYLAGQFISMARKVTFVVLLILTSFALFCGFETLLLHFDSNNIELTNESGVYVFSLSNEAQNDFDIFQIIGNQGPAVMLTAALIVSVAFMWIPYKFSNFFFIELISLIGIGATIAISKDAFYQTSNFYEVICVLGFYMADQYLYFEWFYSNDNVGNEIMYKKCSCHFDFQFFAAYLRFWKLNEIFKMRLEDEIVELEYVPPFM